MDDRRFKSRNTYVHCPANARGIILSAMIEEVRNSPWKMAHEKGRTKGGEILWDGRTDGRTRYHDESDTATTTMMMPRHVMKTPAGTNSAQVRGREGTKIARPTPRSLSIADDGGWA